MLLDIWLNDGTGFDAMLAFKTVIPGARFIFMSAEATPEIVGRARALSACGFVGKHLDANAFTAAVRKVLAGDTTFPTDEAPARPLPVLRARPRHSGDAGRAGPDAAPGLGARAGAGRTAEQGDRPQAWGSPRIRSRSTSPPSCNGWACARGCRSCRAWNGSGFASNPS